jgi:hypothetical protein
MQIPTKLIMTTTAMFFGVLVSGFAYVDGSGVGYTMAKNMNGMVLKSKIATLYLGKNCDAYSPKYGKGTWGWANGGVTVELEKKRIGFPRQDSPFDDTRCRL